MNMLFLNSRKTDERKKKKNFYFFKERGEIMNNQNELSREEKEDLEIQRLEERVKKKKQKKKEREKREKEKARKARSHRLVKSGATAESMLRVEGEEKIRHEIEKFLQLKRYLERIEVFSFEDLRKKIKEVEEKNNE